MHSVLFNWWRVAPGPAASARQAGPYAVAVPGRSSKKQLSAADHMGLVWRESYHGCLGGLRAVSPEALWLQAAGLPAAAAFPASGASRRHVHSSHHVRWQDASALLKSPVLLAARQPPVKEIGVGARAASPCGGGRDRIDYSVDLISSFHPLEAASRAVSEVPWSRHAQQSQSRPSLLPHTRGNESPG